MAELLLNDNQLRRIQKDMVKYLPNLKLLQIQNNQFASIKDDVVPMLRGLPLQDLSISLNHEEEVELIIRALPQLQTLNGLPVDRDELEIIEEPKSPFDKEFLWKDSHYASEAHSSSIHTMTASVVQTDGRNS